MVNLVISRRATDGGESGQAPEIGPPATMVSIHNQEALDALGIQR